MFRKKMNTRGMWAATFRDRIDRDYFVARGGDLFDFHPLARWHQCTLFLNEFDAMSLSLRSP